MKLKLSNNEKKYLQGVLSFNEAEKYIKKFNNKIFVIKYGGSALSNSYLANNFAKDLNLLLTKTEEVNKSKKNKLKIF